PGVNDNAEVVVERGNDVENGEDREYGMFRFNEREENEILAHEPGRGRNACEGKHEDQEQHGGRGAALIETIEILQFLADETVLPQHDEDGKSAGSREDVGKQIIANAGHGRVDSGERAE